MFVIFRSYPNFRKGGYDLYATKTKGEQSGYMKQLVDGDTTGTFAEVLPASSTLKVFKCTNFFFGSGYCSI